MTKTSKLTYSALFLAFGVILPQVFHFFGGTGPVFLPMHIPVLLGGFFLGPVSGLILGILTPVFSSLLTGMPAIPILYFMILELAAYGLFAGIFYRQLRLNRFLALILAMGAGRLVLALGVFTLQAMLGLKLSPAQYLTGALTSGIPGMMIQLVFIPMVVNLLEKAGLTIAQRHA